MVRLLKRGNSWVAISSSTPRIWTRRSPSLHRSLWHAKELSRSGRLLKSQGCRLNRMLKMAASFVLGRVSRCGVAQGYASLAPLHAALLDGHFEHPAMLTSTTRVGLAEVLEW